MNASHVDRLFPPFAYSIVIVIMGILGLVLSTFLATKFLMPGDGAVLLINGLSFSVLTSGLMQLAYKYRLRRILSIDEVRE